MQLLLNVDWARCVRAVRAAIDKGAYCGCNSLPCSDLRSTLHPRPRPTLEVLSDKNIPSVGLLCQFVDEQF